MSLVLPVHFLLHLGPLLLLLLQDSVRVQRRLRNVCVLSNPFVLHHFVNREALVGVDLQHPFDKFLGVAGDVRPLGRRKVVLAGSDSRFHAGADGKSVVAVEGREAAQEDVADNTERPDVA